MPDTVNPRALEQAIGGLRLRLYSENHSDSLDVRLNEEIVGELRLIIRYDPLTLYEGELTQSVNLSMNKEKEYISFYGGKCDKLNAFSFLDESSKGQYCRFS